MIQMVGLLHHPIVLYPQNKTTFYMSRTELRAQAAVYLEHDLYTRDHFSMSCTELRAQAAAYHEERDKKTTRARGDWMVMPQPG